MDNLVMQGYKSGLKIVPTIPRYDNSGAEITGANYWPVPIDSVFRTNYGFNVYTGNGKLVTTTDTTKRFIVTDYGGFTPKNPQESYSAQELYNLVLDARGLTHGKNYALSILDSTTGKSGRVILTASNTAARLTCALTLQLVDSEGNALSNKAVPVNKCSWHLLTEGALGSRVKVEPNVVTPGLTLINPDTLPEQIFLKYGFCVAPFMGRIDGGISGDMSLGITMLQNEGPWAANTTKKATVELTDTGLDFPFWCFGGNTDVLNTLGFKRYRTILSGWIGNIIFHRHANIANNIDSITFEAPEELYSRIYLSGTSNDEECDRAPKPVTDFTADMVTLYDTFGSAGTGWIDEQSM